MDKTSEDEGVGLKQRAVAKTEKVSEKESTSDIKKPQPNDADISGITKIAVIIAVLAFLMIVATIAVVMLTQSDASSKRTVKFDKVTSKKTNEITPENLGPEYIPYNFVVGQVPRIEMDPDDTTFAEKIASKHEPVVLFNTITQKWTALEKWNPDYISKNTPMLKGVQRHDDKTFNYFHETRPFTALKDISAPYKKNTYSQINMTSKSFFEAIENTPPYYYYAATADEIGKPYHDLYPIEPLMVKTENFTLETSYLHRWTNVWFGPAGATTHTHYDLPFNFYAQIFGVKRFILWPPEESENLYLYPFLHPGGQQSQVSLPPTESLLQHFPKFKKTKAIEAILYPGDVLYLPPLWFHHVTALSTSMSVSVWTRFNETKTMYETVRSVLPLKGSWNEKKLALAGKVFLTLVVNKIKGNAKDFVQKLVSERYQYLIDTTPNFLRSDKSFCDSALEPESREEILIENEAVFEEAVNHQVNLFSKSTSVARRDIWLGNFCEQLALTVAGLEHVSRFLVDFSC